LKRLCGHTNVDTGAGCAAAIVNAIAACGASGQPKIEMKGFVRETERLTKGGSLPENASVKPKGKESWKIGHQCLF